MVLKGCTAKALYEPVLLPALTAKKGIFNETV